MDDALRVDDDLDALHFHAKKPMRLDHLQPLIEQSRGIDCDLRPHVPGRMLQRSFDCDGIEVLSWSFAKRSTRGGQNDPTNIGNVQRPTRLRRGWTAPWRAPNTQR